MAGTLFQLPKATPIDNGVTLPGAKITFSQTGTSTPQNVYTDLALSVAHSNPVVADSEGVFAPIYLDGSLPSYRVKLTDSADTLIYQVDDVPSSQKTIADELTISGDAPYVDLIESDASANNGGWRIRATNEQLVIYVMNDAKSVLTEAVVIDRIGTTLSYVNVKALQLQVNGTAISASSSFTAALTGFSANLTPTVQWKRTGNVVVLTVNAGSTDTSTTDSMTMTGLPEEIRPATALTVLCRLSDNGSSVLGVAAIGTGGTITFGNGAAGAAFTASGTKGLPGGFSLMYDLQ